MFLFLIIFALTVPGVAQAKSPLQFVVDNQTFAYNLEWTGIDNIAEGETFIGNILKTYFRYHFHNRLYVETGALLQHPFGDTDRIDEVDPVISLNYSLLPGLKVTAGTIDRNHALHDAFFWETLRFTDPIEQGFQLKGKTKYINQDLWISWEERETSTTREKFSVGNYTQFKWNGFTLDGQMYWVHLGGQKNLGPGVYNNLSIGVGGGYTWKPSREQAKLSFLKELGFTVHWLKNEDDPPLLAPTVDEDGVAFKLFANVFDVNFYFNMWDGGSQNFNSRNGDPTLGGLALAKGNPLYRASAFEEFGAYKIWSLADTVSIRADFRQQWVQGESVEVYSANFQWRQDFDLFEDYFRTHWKGSSHSDSDSARKSRRARSRLGARAR